MPLLLVVLSCFSTLNAQVVKSSSTKTVVRQVENQKQENKDNIWYLKGGLSLMSLIDDHSDGIKLGYKFDWGFKKTIKRLKTNDSFNPYWGMDFSLGNRSVDYDWEDTYTAHNLQWSPNIGLDIALSRYFSFDLHIGPYLSYDYSVKWFDNGFGKPNQFDAGLNMGIGFWINRVELEFCFQKGFTFTQLNNDEGYDIGGKTNILLLKLGYRLPTLGKMKFHKVN